MTHDYDSLFRSIELLDLSIDIHSGRSFNHASGKHEKNRGWTARLHGSDQYGRIVDATGHGPSAYFALLEAKSAIKVERAKPEPTRVIGLGPKRMSGVQLLRSLGL